MKQFTMLAQLLDKGYPLSSSLLIIDPKYQEIVDALEAGQSFDECFLQANSGEFYEHCRFFLELSSLSKAIQNAVLLVESKRKLREQWLKETSYPLFILLFAIVVMFVFTSAIFPQLGMVFADYEGFQSVSILVTALKSLTIILLIGAFLFPLLFIGVIHHQTLGKECFRIPIVKEFVSFQLTNDMLALIGCGCSTKEMFSYMVRMRRNGLKKHAIDELSDMLIVGEDLETAIAKANCISDKMKYFFKCGVHTQNVEACLADYLQLQRDRWSHQLKAACIALQVFAYSFIGIIVVLIYQVMLIPLEMIEGF